MFGKKSSQPKRPPARNKGTPHYDLKLIHDLIKSDKYFVTDKSLQGGNKLGFSETEMLDIVLSLKRSDFIKAMTHYMNYKIWQDVYTPICNSKPLYIKVQISADNKAVVIDFKEA